ncbi:uncharacterized protein LOC142327938 [Lycorma delicatula]|uniref:uncharacterized protein LOC142327938 n=1 Tax=Lycorma delicatula TaxID=130591 RepID=UPI003F518DD1
MYVLIGSYNIGIKIHIGCSKCSQWATLSAVFDTGFQIHNECSKHNERAKISEEFDLARRMYVGIGYFSFHSAVYEEDCNDPMVETNGALFSGFPIYINIQFEKTTKRPDFQTFVSKGKENIVEKTIGSENRSAKKGEKPKKVLSARSLTDAEYDEIFTAAIQRSFTYSSDEKFLSNDNSRENSTFFDGLDSSSTTAPGSKGKKKNIIEPKGSIKMVESNKKPLYEENEGHKNDTGTRKKCRREINEKQSQKHKELNQDGRDDITSDHNEINNNSNKSMTITEKLSSADENCKKISGNNNNSIISYGNESYIGIDDDDNNNEINSSDVVVSCKKIGTDKSTVNDGSVNKNLDKEEMGSREKIHCNDTNNDKYQDSMESFDEGNNDVDEIINNDFMNDTAMKIDKCQLLSGTSMAVDDDNDDFVEVLGSRENQEPISSSVLNNALNDAPNSQSSTQSFNPLIEDVLINRYDCDDELTDSILSNCFVSEGDAVVPNSCSFIESSLVFEE